MHFGFLNDLIIQKYSKLDDYYYLSPNYSLEEDIGEKLFVGKKNINLKI